MELKRSAIEIRIDSAIIRASKEEQDMAYNMQMISVAADDDLNSEVESFRIQHHICTKSEAGAELMRLGLEAAKAHAGAAERR